MNDKRTVDQARIQLGEFNDESMPLEHCVQDMRLASERLKKTVAEAEKAVANTNDLVRQQRENLAVQRKIIKLQENRLKELCNEISAVRARTPA